MKQLIYEYLMWWCLKRNSLMFFPSFFPLGKWEMEGEMRNIADIPAAAFLLSIPRCHTEVVLYGALTPVR